MSPDEFTQFKRLARKFVAELLPDNVLNALQGQPPTEERRFLNQPDSLLTEKQVQEVYGLKCGQLRQWRHHGGGPPFVRLGRSIRYRRSDLEEWIKAQVTKRNTSEYQTA